MSLIKSEEKLSYNELKDHQLFITLDELIKQSILIFPFTKNRIIYDDTNNLVTTNDIKIECINKNPILIPKRIPNDILDYKLKDIIKNPNSFFQYQILSLIKGNGEIVGVNANINSLPYEKHLYRIQRFLKSAKGSFLDIGCDIVSNSSKIIPEGSTYLGIDPFIHNSNAFKIFGIGEALPFVDNSFDNILFNASLDHILDYYEAISEAARVLKKNGTLFLSSYVWTNRATLLSDIVHFHHFRENQLINCIEELFKIEEIKRYECPKNDSHRYEIFLRAKRK